MPPERWVQWLAEAAESHPNVSPGREPDLSYMSRKSEAKSAKNLLCSMPHPGSVGHTSPRGIRIIPSSLILSRESIDSRPNESPSKNRAGAWSIAHQLGTAIS